MACDETIDGCADAKRSQCCRRGRNGSFQRATAIPCAKTTVESPARGCGGARAAMAARLPAGRAYRERSRFCVRGRNVETGAGRGVRRHDGRGDHGHHHHQRQPEPIPFQQRHDTNCVLKRSLASVSSGKRRRYVCIRRSSTVAQRRPPAFKTPLGSAGSRCLSINSRACDGHSCSGDRRDRLMAMPRHILGQPGNRRGQQPV